MTPRHQAGVGDDLVKEGFQMAKGDYRQGQNETGIATHQPLTADGWTIVDGPPEQAIRIDSGTFEMGPLVGIWRCTPGAIEMAALPFHEFVTVFDVSVTASLDGAHTVSLRPGDSFFFPTGARILCHLQA